MEDRGASENNEQLERHTDVNVTTQIMASLEISEKLWGNDLIWEKIHSYLSISNLRELSCVNHYFLKKVRSINRFTSQAGQVVRGKLEIHVFKLSRAIVLVNQLDANTLEERASEIFKDTEYLEIHCLANLSCADRNSRLIQIVANCPKLKSLTFGPYTFSTNKIVSFLTHSSVKLILSKLEELHLEVYNGKYFSSDDRNEWEMGIKSQSHLEILTDPIKSFKLLSDLQMSLFKFSYEAEPCQYFVTCFISPELVLSSSQNTLAELNLKVGFGATLGLTNMEFPKLEKYSLMINDSMTIVETGFDQRVFDMNFGIFLKNHLLSLTHFELETPRLDYVSYTGVCKTLSFSKKIRVLSLGKKAARKSDFGTTSIVGREWDNLANIRNLYSLDVFTEYHERELVFKITDNLANFRRYGEILHPKANSFKFYCQGWKDLDNQEYFTATVPSTFRKFQNLVELKLFAFLNDEILQFVCKHLTKLRVFEGDFSDVSDYGLSGLREEDNYNSGISIANIKGLRRLCIHLRLAREFNFTWDSLLQSIHFLELVELKVMGALKNTIKNDMKQVNRSNYLRLICKSRNPSLEKVFLECYEPHPDDGEDIRRVNPRTKFYDGDLSIIHLWAEYG